ncbi:cyclase family protein [candidate division KSB1 bacterium]|nr:cyclase family protein [candidate division KSB1 bacterium]
MKIYDITRTLGIDNITFPGDPEFMATPISNIDQGDASNMNRLHLTSHSGTHLDAPLHFFNDAWSLDKFPVGRFILDVKVVSIEDSHKIRQRELERYEIVPGQGILFKTKNSLLPRDIFSERFVDLDEQAAAWLVAKRVSLVGIDYLSIELSENTDFPVHRALLEAGILILEDVDLSAIEPGEYRLICLPLKFHRSDGAPCRAILIDEG